MENVNSILEVSEGISNFGFMVIVCAIFVVLSFTMWIFIFKWFKKIIDTTIKDNAKIVKKLLNQTESQNELLNDIADALRPTTLLQVKNISSTCFDLSMERVCHIINKVKEENNIINKEATLRKIKGLLQNLHDDRNSRFDNYSFKGKKLTEYTNGEWVEWVTDVVVNEVYNEQVNSARTLTNVKSVYDRIKLDFYHNLTE